MPDRYKEWRPHPWHGLDVGREPPEWVYAYIEITPFDLVKYEVDKATGYLKVDRPQRGASQPPTLYGFIPQTYCGERVAALSPKAQHGDGDPMDICVVSERPIARAEVILNARVVGALQMVDTHEADDKVVAVLEGDGVWGDVRDVADLPSALIGRLRHYFTTYKAMPGEDQRVTIEKILDRDAAFELVRAAQADYTATFAS